MMQKCQSKNDRSVHGHVTPDVRDTKTYPSGSAALTVQESIGKPYRVPDSVFNTDHGEFSATGRKVDRMRESNMEGRAEKAEASSEQHCQEAKDLSADFRVVGEHSVDSRHIGLIQNDTLNKLIEAERALACATARIRELEHELVVERYRSLEIEQKYSLLCRQGEVDEKGLKDDISTHAHIASHPPFYHGHILTGSIAEDEEKKTDDVIGSSATAQQHLVEPVQRHPHELSDQGEAAFSASNKGRNVLGHVSPVPGFAGYHTYGLYQNTGRFPERGSPTWFSPHERVTNPPPKYRHKAKLNYHSPTKMPPVPYTSKTPLIATDAGRALPDAKKPRKTPKASAKSKKKVKTVDPASKKGFVATDPTLPRGVTMRPSGKWQAQFYFAGQSRYIGVFDTREKAAKAYEIVRKELRSGGSWYGKQSSQSPEDTKAQFVAAQKAAYAGVGEKFPS